MSKLENHTELMLRNRESHQAVRDAKKDMAAGKTYESAVALQMAEMERAACHAAFLEVWRVIVNPMAEVWE